MRLFRHIAPISADEDPVNGLVNLMKKNIRGLNADKRQLAISRIVQTFYGMEIDCLIKELNSHVDN